MASVKRGPFYIGQPADHVWVVAKRTGRKFTKPPRVLNPAEVTTETGDFNLSAVAEYGIVQCQYPDVILTFQRGKRPDGKGAECFRIIEIEWRGANG